MYEEMKLYNQIASHCIKRCANQFRNKEIIPPEDTCLKNCFAKVTEYNNRFIRAVNEANFIREYFGDKNTGLNLVNLKQR